MQNENEETDILNPLTLRSSYQDIVRKHELAKHEPTREFLRAVLAKFEANPENGSINFQGDELKEIRKDDERFKAMRQILREAGFEEHFNGNVLDIVATQKLAVGDDHPQDASKS